MSSTTVPPLPPIPPPTQPVIPLIQSNPKVKVSPPGITNSPINGNSLIPPLPPLPPSDNVNVDGSDSDQEGVDTSKDAAAASEPLSKEVAESKQSYIIINGLKASIDSSIDQYVKDLTDRVSLKELPVNGPGKSGESGKSSKFALADGEFPKLQVDLYEQMVYHRAGSFSLKPLEILVPTRYKINHEKINQYFSENANDEGTKLLVSSVIKEYGNNNNSLFYKHTISGKSNDGGLDLDQKKRELIEGAIDKWHNDYTGWIFYDNASSFFVQNQNIPRDELITLKIELDGVFLDGTSTLGLQAYVDESIKKYIDLSNLYETKGRPVYDFFRETLAPYITFFNAVFKTIKEQMNDQLNFVTNRKEYMGSSYDFNDTIKDSLFKTYEELKMMLDNFGNITVTPLLKILSVINVFKKGIFELNKKFPLKTVFDDYILNQRKIMRSNVVYSRSSVDKIYNIEELNQRIDDIKPSDRGDDDDFESFKTDNIKFKDRPDSSSSPELISFGFQEGKIDLDILFYLLYRATNNVIYKIMQSPKLFEGLDEIKTPDLRKLQQEVDLKEKKLKNICDLIAKTGKFPVERILPDSAKYYYKTEINSGFVNTEEYKKEWTKILTNREGQINSSNIILAISKMKKKLEEALGIYNESGLKVKNITNTLVSTLIEHNTVQVMNMLFSKPRNVIYSPGMRTNFISAVSKWLVFQLGKPEIISKRAFKQFKDRLLQVINGTTATNGSATPKMYTLIDYIIQKREIPEGILDLKGDLPFGIFIVSTDPGPQLLPPGKDCANDSRFENSSFAAGAMANGGMVDDGSVIGALKNQFDKLNLFKKVNTANCADARKQIGNAFDEMSEMAMGSLKEIGVDIEKKLKVDLPAKLASSSANAKTNATAVASAAISAASANSATSANTNNNTNNPNGSSSSVLNSSGSSNIPQIPGGNNAATIATAVVAVTSATNPVASPPASATLDSLALEIQSLSPTLDITNEPNTRNFLNKLCEYANRSITEIYKTIANDIQGYITTKNSIATVNQILTEIQTTNNKIKINYDCSNIIHPTKITLALSKILEFFKKNVSEHGIQSSKIVDLGIKCLKDIFNKFNAYHTHSRLSPNENLIIQSILNGTKQTRIENLKVNIATLKRIIEKIQRVKKNDDLKNLFTILSQMNKKINDIKNEYDEIKNILLRIFQLFKDDKAAAAAAGAVPIAPAVVSGIASSQMNQIPPPLPPLPIMNAVAPGGPAPPPPPAAAAGGPPPPPAASAASAAASTIPPTILPIPPPSPAVTGAAAAAAPAVVDPNIDFLEEIKGLLKKTSDLFNPFDFQPVINPLDTNTLVFNYISGANPTANVKDKVSLAIESRIGGIYNLFTQHTQKLIGRKFPDFGAELTQIFNNLSYCSNQTVNDMIYGAMDEIRATIIELPGRTKDIINREEQILYNIGETDVKSVINHNLDNLDPNNHASIRDMFTQIHSECERLLEQYNTSIATVDREIGDLYTKTETTIRASIQDNTQKLIECIRKTTKTYLDRTKVLLNEIQGKITDPAGTIPAGIQKGNGILEQIDNVLQSVDAN